MSYQSERRSIPLPANEAISLVLYTKYCIGDGGPYDSKKGHKALRIYCLLQYMLSTKLLLGGGKVKDPCSSSTGDAVKVERRLTICWIVRRIDEGGERC